MKIDMLVLADDFTGALDTGIQFAKNGAETSVTADPDSDFSGSDARVLVIDTETRHMTPEAAGERIADIVSRAVRSGVTFIYKKTDSALRGNVGAELGALLRASGGDVVHFVPAFPAMRRVVRGGVLYVDGVPVAESVFGKDPFEPVTCSEVSEILARQTDTPVVTADMPEAAPRGIVVYNAETDDGIGAITGALDLEGRTVLLAGCAGLAASLGARFRFSGGRRELPDCRKGLLVVCGSVNEVTRRQVARARGAGFGYENLPIRDKLTDFLQTPEGDARIAGLVDRIRENDSFIIDTNDLPGEETAAGWGAEHGMEIREVGAAIADSLGYLVSRLLDESPDRMLLLTGGDVLFHSMSRMGVTRLKPLAEVSPGVILSSFVYRGRERFVLTKSGGFGGEDLLTELGGRYRPYRQAQ